MKKFHFACFIMALSTSAICQSQLNINSTKPEPLSMIPISVTVNKTTNLVFPFRIRNVDRGVEGLLVQKVDGAEHILQVKAANAAMPETNLSVVTVDMKLYVFLVHYDSSSTMLNYQLKNDAGVETGDQNNCFAYVHEPLTEGAVERLAEIAAAKKPYLHHTADKSFGVAVKLNGIYVHQDVLFFSLQLENGTAINYDMESLQLSIQDQKRSKLTATQEVILQKRYAWGDTSMIESHTGQRLVLAVSKFTIPDKKHCVLQLREMNGGRNLDLIFGNRLLMQAKEID